MADEEEEGEGGGRGWQGTARRFDLISFSFADNPRSQRFVTRAPNFMPSPRAARGWGGIEGEG